jgi:hypothetical protein
VISAPTDTLETMAAALRAGLMARVGQSWPRDITDHRFMHCGDDAYVQGRPNPLRAYLFRRNPHCHWCGTVTVLEQRVKHNGTLTNHHNTATLDHMKSRLMGRRLHERTARVLACSACNHTRACMEDRMIRGHRVPVQWLRLFMSGLDGDGI